MNSPIPAIALCLLPSSTVALELSWDFEAGIPGEHFETDDWSARDTTYAHGPRIPPREGGTWVGTPTEDLAQYPGFLVASLTTRAIDLGRLGMAALYVSWAQWGDFEGVASNFDGAQLRISTDGGSSWRRVDDPPSGALGPPYDALIASGLGTPISGEWAYCFDTDVEGDLADAMASTPLWKSVATADLIALGYATPDQSVRLRWLFASDALEGGQGYFIDDLRIADTPPECEIPPRISIDPRTDTPDTLLGYEVSAFVEQVCAAVDEESVRLHYWSDVSDTNEVFMPHVGGDNYSAMIPAQPIDTDVWFWVSATDVLGNEGRTSTLTFEVTEAITLAWDDGLPFFIDPEFYGVNNGIAVRFTAPTGADTTYSLYKLLCHFGGFGRFRTGVWDEDGPDRTPGSRLYRRGPMGNDIIDGWWAHEFADSTLRFTDGEYFYVGYTFTSGDSLKNPKILYDEALDEPGSSWRLINGQWQVDAQAEKGGPLLRVKVKRSTGTGIGDGNAIPEAPTVFDLHGNYPNPFNPRTVIRYQLPAQPSPMTVRVSVFDLAGHAVAGLVDEVQAPGAHSLHWEGISDTGHALPSGVYILHVEAGESSATHKMIILK